jgi:hypothetical protein
MSSWKDLFDRRNQDRSLALGGAFAVLRPQFSKLGQIIDISSDGLAIHYPVSGDQTNGSSELDIFLVGDGIYLEKVPFKAISDLKLVKKKFNGSIPMRRLGVQFGELKQSQISQLEYFIGNYTLDNGQQTTDRMREKRSSKR